MQATFNFTENFYYDSNEGLVYIVQFHALAHTNIPACDSRASVAMVTEKAVNGDEDQLRSPAKSDTLRSTDSASGGETLEESGRSSKEVGNMGDL